MSQEPPATTCDGTGTVRDYGIDGPEVVLCPGCENCEPKQPIPVHDFTDLEFDALLEDTLDLYGAVFKEMATGPTPVDQDFKLANTIMQTDILKLRDELAYWKARSAAAETCVDLAEALAQATETADRVQTVRTRRKLQLAHQQLEYYKGLEKP
jgi:hypothetical protein